MSADLVQIVLVGGPRDGETHAIPADAAGVNTWCFPPPCPLSVVTYWDPTPIPQTASYLHYRPKLADFAGWLAPSITDDGAMRYEYVGEW